MKRKLAVLTAEEKHAWESYFAFYVDEGLKDDEADSAAWKDLQDEFPRLKEFDGCEA